MDLFNPKSATKISSATAFVLMIGKIIVGLMSGSIAILASALDSFLDFLVSVMNYFTVQEAQKPADREHRYGHGKFEALAELIQGIIIGGSGLFLAYYGVKKILNPTPLEYQNIALLVMIVSFGITLLLFLYLQKTAKKTGSLVVKTDATHYWSDILSNSALIGGILGMMYFDVFWIDGVLSLVMAGFIIHSSIGLIFESFKILTDHEINDDQRNRIIEILDSAKEIQGWHQLRTRYSGSSIFVDVHLEFLPDIILLKAHDIAHRIEKQIEGIGSEVFILTHFDAHRNEDNFL